MNRLQAAQAYREDPMGSRLFRTKSYEQLQAEAGEHALGLRRSLGPGSLVALGIGIIIGAGLFAITGPAAAKYAGPAILLSFLLAGTACAFAGLCYAEMAAMIPVAGSAYTYAYATLGELMAWIIGWDLILEYAFAAATVAVSWSGYLCDILQGLGLEVPAALRAGPGLHLLRLADGRWEEATPQVLAALGAAGLDPATLAQGTGMINLPAVFIVLLLTALAIFGIRESAHVNSAIVLVKLAIVLAVILVGLGHVHAANWQPFLPPNSGEFGHYGLSGVVRGAAVVFFAYIGFDAVSTTAQEARNPSRDMPIGILGSLFISTLLYVAFAAVLTGIIPYQELNAPDAVAFVMAKTGHPLLGTLVQVGIVAGLSSVILVSLIAQPRVFWAMSRDGLLPLWAGRVHPTRQTPHITTLVTGIFVALMAGMLPIDVLGEMTSIGTLLAFLLVCAGIIALRLRRPELPRPFRVPAVWLVAPAGILVCAYLMLGLPLATWLRLLAWLAIGLALYFAYGRRHSHLARPTEI
jgi:basic amino acid/polyamine antiporter, APA family